MRGWPYRIYVDSMATNAYDDKETVDLGGWTLWTGYGCLEVTGATGAGKHGYERRVNDRV